MPSTNESLCWRQTINSSTVQKCGRAEVLPTQGRSEVASLKDKEATNFRTSEGEVEEQEKCA